MITKYKALKEKKYDNFGLQTNNVLTPDCPVKDGKTNSSKIHIYLQVGSAFMKVYPHENMQANTYLVSP